MQQQRQLRLGDILDDYCPRERRLANHTVVAMVGDDVRLTRCTTCDTEHPYKGGKVPRQRQKKSAVAAAYDEVLESVKKESEIPGVLVTHADAVESEADASTDAAAHRAADGEAGLAREDGPMSDADHASDDEPAAADAVRMHRQLIRASLPRVDAQPAARPIPEFTIRQANRSGRFQNPRAARFSAGRGAAFNDMGNSRGQGGQGGGRSNGRPQQGHGAQSRQGSQGSGGRPGQYQNAGKKRSR